MVVYVGSDASIMRSSGLCSRHKILLCLLPSPHSCKNRIQATKSFPAVSIISHCSLTVSKPLPREFASVCCSNGFRYTEKFADQVCVRLRWNRLNSFHFRRCGQDRSRIKMFARFDPGGSNSGNDGVGRVVWNLALGGALTYLTITGKLGWLFDAFVSLWLLGILLPVVGLVAFLWFADREIMTGNCPNCGNEFQVFKFTLKEESQLCPYCSQPFRSDGQQFVRDLPHFSSQANSFKEAFKGFGQWKSSSAEKSEPPGVVVDVEAEILDKDEAGR